ncbi:MAG: chemotaxis protein CheB [Bacteroidia bacterium]|nr:chemotaxis protein CheB [Bacteroidia bacterium]MDW8345456.1 chemotaxis protein CheB [Bacteroidia bacterium]
MNIEQIIVIGGSAGSFPVVNVFLSQIPRDFSVPIILCLHRLKNVRHGFAEALNLKTNIRVIEPRDKEQIKPNTVYLAPANYHLLVDYDHTFAYSIAEAVRYSRPSIDVLFTSAAWVFQDKVIGILLSGANTDGTDGMSAIYQKGGITIVQEPSTCTVETMTGSAVQNIPVQYILPPEKIIPTVISLTQKHF